MATVYITLVLNVKHEELYVILCSIQQHALNMLESCFLEAAHVAQLTHQ